MANLKTEDLNRLSTLMTDLADARANKAEANAIKEKIMDFMRETGIKSFRENGLYIRFTEARTTNEFDAELLRTKYPDIWKECHSEQVRPAHLLIKKVAKPKDDEPTDEELDEA